MHELFAPLIHWYLNSLGSGGYLAVALFMALESSIVPLPKQDRSLWNRAMIAEGLALVAATLPKGRIGPYQIQAAIAALHDEASRAEDTDWPQILALYGVLMRLSDNPMIALNHAVAVAMVHGARAGLALVAIVLLLYVDFGAWRPTLLVALTIPFALVGGVAAVWLTGGVLSLGSLVGFVTVLGIAARNGIMLVSHFRHLEAEEGVPFGPELVLRGAEERLAPILMTALATGLALLPLAITGNKPGQEIEYPLAVVILGGLVTSTLLNLFLLPPLYARFGRPVGPRSEA